VTPFGKMGLVPQTGPPAAPPPAGTLPPPPIPASVDQFFALIKADKTELSLKPGGTDRVIISNGTPGLIDLEISRQIPGVEAKLDSGTVPGGGKAVLTVQAGQQPTTGLIGLRIRPIGPHIAIKVSVE